MKISQRTIKCGILLLPFFLLLSCSEDYLPKPKGYNKIDLPPHDFQVLAEVHPYTFEYSKHAELRKDEFANAEPHWINVYYPSFNAYIQLTYKQVKGKVVNLDEHIDDSHKLAGKHNVKAYSIEEGQVKTPQGYTATIFELTGEVPSQFQFYVTDSAKHFLRGAIYFLTATKNDSLAPVIEYMKYDAMHMVNTLEWKEVK